jgi:hypothetical protein
MQVARVYPEVGVLVPCAICESPRLWGERPGVLNWLFRDPAIMPYSNAA